MRRYMTCDALPSVDAASAGAAATAATLLRLCGFVVLRGAVSGAQALAEAYQALPKASLATADLRDGRKEQLLPFASPFADLLHTGAWMAVAEDYLGANALDLDAVTAVLAPEGSPEQAQWWHT